MFNTILLLLVFCLSFVNIYITLFSIIITGNFDNFLNFNLTKTLKVMKIERKKKKKGDR